MNKAHKAMIFEWLRWILVLPGSLVSAILIMFPIHWAVMLIQFTYKKGDTIDVEGLYGLLACIPPEMLERFGEALFVPMILIITAVKIAPRFKFQTGIAIAILWGTLCGFSIGVILLGKTHLRIDMSWLRWVITITLWIAGYACGLYYAHKKSLRKN
jgi:hypothetical protein